MKDENELNLEELNDVAGGVNIGGSASFTAGGNFIEVDSPLRTAGGSLAGLEEAAGRRVIGSIAADIPIPNAKDILVNDSRNPKNRTGKNHIL